MSDHSPGIIIRVAVPVPLRHSFDYLLPETAVSQAVLPGTRVLVPFGRNKLVGIVDEIDPATSIDSSKLKRIIRIIDDNPLINKNLIWLCHWASQYYQYPLGEVYAAALPSRFRQDKPVLPICTRVWSLTEAGRQAGGLPKRAVRLAGLLRLLGQAPDGLTGQQIGRQMNDWRPVLRKFAEKGWVEGREGTASLPDKDLQRENPHRLNDAQQNAVSIILEHLDSFAVFLIHGITGSGKTEVYLQTMTRVLGQGRQVLILVPEIGLTPQLLQRFSDRFAVDMTVFHSGLNETERAQSWLRAKTGQARIIIGTRSAVFAALDKPGLVIVDEEHDLSFKQQDGFRYSGRDLAIVRARREGVPVILGSATPSLESMLNAIEGRYRLLELPERAGSASHPQMRLIDLRHQALEEGLSTALLGKIREHIDQQGQVLLFLNRRGYAPTLLCHDCGYVSHCKRCDSHMTLHMASRQLRCHHCGAEHRLDKYCPDCGSADLRPIGQGTERTEEVLNRTFPDSRVARIDRDTTRRKGEMERKLKDAESGKDQILLGTQLLAKGHHFPNVTLVAILDSDQGLFSTDFRGAERMAQLILQVAGRAGRADRPGEVLIQTHHPDHPLLQLATRQDYRLTIDTLLDERKSTGWPPYSHLALLRAEAVTRNKPLAFLQEAEQMARQTMGQSRLMLLGPVPSPMEKRAGRFRAQLLVQSGNRSELHDFLVKWLDQITGLKSSRQVRWSLDIDPQEMY
ncbi:MAG TPA: primosomal protein N' [Gammaproteobacteria bacterium]|nr:primosomal protein N' [Gammaproteobacteria bacterium]